MTCMLERCDGCARHVRADEVVCPFCRREREATIAAPAAFARVSRAAVFAGATAISGCWSGSSAGAEGPPPPPPPVSSDAGVEVTTNETTEGNGQTFAAPPGGTGGPTAGTTAGVEVVGTVNDWMGQPIGGAGVVLFPGQLQMTRAPRPERPVGQVNTDASGTFRFADVPPGTYTLQINAGVQGRQGWPIQYVVVPAGQRTPVTTNVTIDMRPPRPMNAPYGAPPSRRRVV